MPKMPAKNPVRAPANNATGNLWLDVTYETLDAVEVRQDHVAHSRAQKHDRRVAAQTAQADDADPLRPELGAQVPDVGVGDRDVDVRSAVRVDVEGQVHG